MNAYGIAFNDVSAAMASENVELPPGKIYGIIRSLPSRPWAVLQRKGFPGRDPERR